MAKTGYLQIPTELKEKYYSSLQSMDRFTIPRIRTKTAALSKKKLQEIKNRSYLSICGALWADFSDVTKQNWKSADPHFQQHGWRTFVADQCSRIKLGLEGVATPNQYHQNMVGQILIEAPAEEIKLYQSHPSSYWIAQKVIAKKNMYEPVEINEMFALPAKIAINYKSNLISTGPGSFAHFYASIRHLYQGQNLNRDLTIEIPLQSDWDTAEAEISQLPELAISYHLYLQLYKVRGTLLFDNPKMIHSAQNFYSDYGIRTYGTFKYAEWSGQNWVRDPFCNQIEQTFNRGFFQVLRHWEPITLPEGASYKSTYPS